MVRAAAKNHENVAVLTNPSQYKPFLKILQEGRDGLTPQVRKELALKAFEHFSSVT